MLNYRQIIACFCCISCFVEDSYLLAHYHFAKLNYSYDIVVVEKRYTATGKRIDEPNRPSLWLEITSLWKHY